MQLNKEKALDFYRDMVRIRQFEITIAELFSQGMVTGNIHTYVGQEGVAVGVIQALELSDVITCTHRSDGYFVARGCNLGKLIAELMGKRTGYCKGKGGKMHLAAIEKGMLGANGIVGAGIPLACGAALQFKLSKTPQIAVSFFGDGAVNHGYFHEALNLASLWELPVLFVCDNNQYAISTPISKAMAVEHVIDRAQAYKIPGILVDGTDVLAVYEAAIESVSHVRNGRGPVLLECVTHRIRGHHERDTQAYRPVEEIREAEKRDVIKGFELVLLEDYGVSTVEIDCIWEDVKKEINAAVEYGINSPIPDINDLYEDVFVENGGGVG
jgi:TPP-dependent pyruvate/acetoin dehydrogenase alpha subunit